MLGFGDAACAITTSQFGIAESSSPIWMDNVQCTGLEDVLDQCDFSGWDNAYLCNHANNDAGIVCVNSKSCPKSLQLHNNIIITYMYYFPVSHVQLHRLVHHTISDWLIQPQLHSN